MGKKQTIAIVSRENEDDRHEIDVTNHIDTSNYDSVIEGLFFKVDFERYYIDSDEADAEHARLTGGATGGYDKTGS